MLFLHAARIKAAGSCDKHLMIYACVCRNLSAQQNFMLIHLLLIIFYVCITYIQISAKNVSSFNVALLSEEKRIILLANKIIKLSKNQWNTKKQQVCERVCVENNKIAHRQMRSARGRILQLRLYVYIQIRPHGIVILSLLLLFYCCFSFRIIILTHRQYHLCQMAMEKSEKNRE